jgi:RNA polymerase sigma-70 factor (sigma-E family)
VDGPAPAGTSGSDRVGTRMDPDEVLTALYTAHYAGLVRLAAFLMHDRDSAEEVVQDAYVKVHGRWRGVRDLDKGEAYLRQTVVNLSRSRLRHRTVVTKHAPAAMPDGISAEVGAMESIERSSVVAALAALPQRQREAIVLRYYADLSEAQTAHAMGISNGAVKSHTSRGMAALRSTLLEEL